MQPYYQRAGVTLYHANCLELIHTWPSAQVAAVITDPPYSSGGLTMGERSRDPADKYFENGSYMGRSSFLGDNRDQRSFGWWCTLWLSECHRLVQPGGYCLLFSDWRQLPLASDVLQAGHFVWRGIVVWDKGGGSRAPHKGYFRHQCEFVAWGTHGPCPKATHGGPWPGCYQHPVRRTDKFHLTGKPTPLMVNLVQCVRPGETVLDPFAGSGTTGIACLQTGRQWIGIELSEVNCEIAAKRLEAAALGVAVKPTDLLGQPLQPADPDHCRQGFSRPAGNAQPKF